MSEKGTELHTVDPTRMVLEPDLPKRYLLFVGPGPQETSGRLVASFTDEDQARRAFVTQRLQDATADAWARLTVVDPSGTAHVLCWFGPALDLAGDLGLAAGETPKLSVARQARQKHDMDTTALTASCAGAPVLRRPDQEPAEKNTPLFPPFTGEVTATSAKRARARGSRRVAVVLIVAAGVALSGAWLIKEPPPAEPTAVKSSVPPLSTSVPIGHEVIGERQMTFPAGTARSWETSDGLHQLTVIAGTLSVDDGHGHRWDYRAGDGYVAGWSRYTTLNRTSEAVHVTVRYLRSSANGNAAPLSMD